MLFKGMENLYLDMVSRMDNGSHQCRVALIWEFTDILIANIFGVKSISLPISNSTVVLFK